MVSACLLVGCGTLVDDRYRGRPLMTFTTEFLNADPTIFEPARGRLRFSMFYASRGLQRTVPPEELIEHEATSVILDPPNTLTWTIYDVPEARHFTTTRSGKSYAVGIPFAYVDLNDNGRRDLDERLVGEAPVAAFIHAPVSLDPDESPTGRPFESSTLALVARPMWCTRRPPEPAERQDCGVPLGASCTENTECGAGVCLRGDPWPWPFGRCALPVSSGCAPMNAHVWRNHRDRTQSYWLESCASDADCRPSNYRCDAASSVCLPLANLGVRLTHMPFQPVCQPP